MCKTLDGTEWVLGNSALSNKGYTTLGQALTAYQHLRYLDASDNELGSGEGVGEGDAEEEAGKEEAGEGDETTETAETKTHPLQALTGLTSLLALNLKNNSITTFPKELKLPNLQIANVSHNRITDLPFNAAATPTLRDLDVSENSLTHVEGLDGIATLRTLNISNNVVVSSLLGLGTLSSLEKINAANCDLQDLIGLSGLSRSFISLNVASNKISSLTGLTADGAGSNLSGLTNINLSNNTIENLDELTALGSLSGLIAIDLSGNPCADVDEFRTEVILRLPKIKSIDGQDVTVEEAAAAKALGQQRTEEAAVAAAEAAAAAAAAEAEAGADDE